MDINTDIVALSGLATGVLALIGMVYAVGYKLGKIETKISFLWGIAMEEAIKGQKNRGNLRRDSAIALTDQQRELYGANSNADVREALEGIGKRRRLPTDTSEISYIVIRELSFDVVAGRAEELELTMHDYLAFCVAQVLDFHAEFRGIKGVAP